MIELIELSASDLRGPELLKLNSFGQVPILVDGNVMVADSNAILIHRAKKSERKDWLPENAADAAKVQKRLSVAANEIANGPCAARHDVNVPLDAPQATARAHKVLQLVDQALADCDWIAGPDPMIADIALYSYISHAPEGNVQRSGCLNIAGWLGWVEAIDGFLPFPQIAAGLCASRSAG